MIVCAVTHSQPLTLFSQPPDVTVASPKAAVSSLQQSKMEVGMKMLMELLVSFEVMMNVGGELRKVQEAGVGIYGTRPGKSDSGGSGDRGYNRVLTEINLQLSSDGNIDLLHIVMQML